MSKEFKRQDHMRYGKIGKNRKKLQKWRKPKGRDSKMRLKRKSYPATVSVGYQTEKAKAGKINGLVPIRVENVSDLEKVGKDNIVIVAKVGAKKKLDIIKAAKEKKMKLYNVNTEATK